MRQAVILLALALCASAYARQLQEIPGDLARTAGFTPVTLTEADLIKGHCAEYGKGVYADITSPTPLCSTSYIECFDNFNGTKWSGLLGTVTSWTGKQVPAVFNAFSGPGGPGIPGGLGTMRCDCDAIFEDDVDAANACKVCSALQETGLCDPKEVLKDETYSCVAFVPGSKSKYINCGLAGSFVQDGNVIVDKITAAVITRAIDV